MPKNGTILVANFTDFELWTEFHLMQIGNFLSSDPSWLQKQVYRCKMLFRPLNIHNSEEQK